MIPRCKFEYSHTVGFLANQGRGFNNPVDLAFDESGLMYVLNRAGPEVGIRLPYKRITICNVEEEYLGEFSTGGQADGNLWWPSSIAISKDHRIFVSDEALDRITVFDGTGKFVKKWGAKGGGEGQFNRISYIAFDADDNLLISDSLNNRIQLFDKDGNFLSTWGRAGIGDGCFNMPWGICVDKHRNIYVADWRNDRIQKFDCDGKFKKKWDNNNITGVKFNRPASLAVDPESNIYVADWGNERVIVINQEGHLLAEFYGDSAPSKWASDYFRANPTEYQERLAADLDTDFTSGPSDRRDTSAKIEKLFWGPTAIKLDNQGRVYVVDSARHRIQIYKPLDL